MSLSPFARRAVVCMSLAGCCTSLLTAEPAYLPFGNESAPGGLLPGEQGAPHVSVNSSGGFIVWQDNTTDGIGAGIRAVGLDNNLVASQAPFRVNYEARGDQETPQAAVFPAGGAAFFWRGGNIGAQRVYARFLSSSNTWLTGDILVSSPTNHVRTAPSLTVLTNGNLLAVWSSSDQRATGSMADVYGQLFTSAGQKLGGTFSINQFTPFNQRAPVAAALPNGGFVVAWISEQQRRAVVVTTNEFIYTGVRETVDVYTRVYNAYANALGNEILVSTNSATLCMAPSIAAAPDSGFIVTWAQGTTRDFSNTSDIFARAFTSLAEGGATERVNAHIQGMQFPPKIAGLGNDFMVLWTSRWQDGSYDGVFGQFLNRAAKPVGNEFKVNTTVVLDQNQADVAADDFCRFIAVWKTSSLQDKVREEICAQVYAPPGFAPLASATNYAGPVFVGPPPAGNGGTTNVVATVPSLPFPVTPTQGDVPLDGFARARGSYVGLLYNKFGVTAVDSGYVTGVTSATGGYSVTLRVGLRSYTLSGRFDFLGNSTREIPRAGKPPIRVALHLDLLGADQLRGTFSDGQSECEFLADRLVYSGANPCSLAGRYNLVISSPDADGATPDGFGYGSMTISADGKAALVIKLADGTVITQSTAVSKKGILPLYAGPYNKRGVVLGWVKIENGEANGDVVWIKPASVAKYYPSGFAGMCELNGSLYNKPGLGKRVLELTDGNCLIELSGGCLDEARSTSLIIDEQNRVTIPAASGVRLLLDTLTGTFQGSFLNVSDNTRVLFGGKMLQGDNYGAGHFLHKNASGRVLLTSPTP